MIDRAASDAIGRVHRDGEAALAAAQEDGVGLLGLCILYDISVNHGPGTDSESFGGIVAAARKAAPPPSKGGSETAYLSKLTDLRNTVLKGWGDIQDGNGRVYMHRQLIANNPGMTLPITWTCYGDPFSITSMPTEGGLAAVDLTDEADIIVAADSSNFDGAALVGVMNSNSISIATRDDYVIRFPGAQWLAGFRQMARNVCSILYDKQTEVPRTHAIVKLTFTANDMLAQPNTSGAHGATPSRNLRETAVAGMSGVDSVPPRGRGTYGSTAFQAATSATVPSTRCGRYAESSGAGANSPTTPAARPLSPNPPVRAIAARRAPVPGGAPADSSRTHALPAPNAAPDDTPHARWLPREAHGALDAARRLVGVR